MAFFTLVSCNRFEKRFKFTNHLSIRLIAHDGQLHLLSVPILDTHGYTGRGDVDVYGQRDLLSLIHI